MVDLFNKKKIERLEEEKEEINLSYINEMESLRDDISELRDHFDYDSKLKDRLYTNIESLKKLSYVDRETMLGEILKVYYRNPYGRNIIDVITNFICGGNFIFNALDSDGAVQDYLDEFYYCPENKMGPKFREIVLRTLRDGEVFIRYIEKKGNKFPLIRLLDSLDIREIKTDIKDIEKIKYYHYYIENDEYINDEDDTSQSHKDIDQKNILVNKKIIGNQIQHIKINVDSNVKRGRSILEPALQMIKYYEDWVWGRVLLNRLKSSIFLEKIIDVGSPSDIASMKSQHNRRENVTDRESYKIPRPGTLSIHTSNIKYQWVEPKIEAKDTAEDGRQIRLAIAAAVGLPEFMLTSDASNANYSSSLVSQNPIIRKIKDLQTLFSYEFQSMFKRVINYGIENGHIPPESSELILKKEQSDKIKKNKFKLERFEEELNEEEIEDIIGEIKEIEIDINNYEEVPCETKKLVYIEWPPILHTDEESLTRALAMQHNIGVVSKETIAGRLGYNISDEIVRRRNEKLDPEIEDVQIDDENDKIINKYSKNILRDK